MPGVAITNKPNLVVLNNLTVGSSTVTGAAVGLNVASTSQAGVSIGGNITVNASNTLNFTPGAIGNVQLNGSIPQAINGPVAPTFGVNATLVINNSSVSATSPNTAGVTLNLPLLLPVDLNLTLGTLNTTPTNVLTMPSTAAANNGSDQSFVNGPVVRTTTGPVTSLKFPVGKFSAAGAGNYRPLFLTTTNQATAINYTAEQKEMSAGGNIGVTAPLDHVSFKRYYTLTPNVQPLLSNPTFNATIALSFGSNDYVTDPTLASFVIAKRDLPTLWMNIGHGGNSATTLSSSPFTTFSDFSLASTVPSTTSFPGINPLPVELARFSATAQGNGVNLSWATAQEKNNDRFDVQRSADGSEFATIGTVKGQGNSTSAHEYAFADARPLAGLSYYRLRQVDQDGTSTFSPVAAVQLKHAGDLAYPNPSNGLITLAASLGAVEYRIVNNLGQTLLRGHATGNDRLDLAPLPKGIYFLELTGQSSHSTQRLVRE